ncbi:Zn-dependent oxidoreductase, NADPH:quinone reductase [Mycolicibacterium novocastrense]|uniref:Zn-dependent oxidoreductase, NADPH:quinone reductase n=1 Tax=Mycolicibacterium novocastrense TaxID=59813 RepID=A0ABQ0KGJ9_MYCNV|nr:Zn-dependent oxidoreductase, NADPH:quinone reductase [Mycolicibacterium novocastrense]
MKALVAQELTGPAGLVYTDVDDVGGEDVVVVDVGAAGVSFPDLLLLRGEYQLRLEPPFVPGMEVAGVVRSAPYESEYQPGQRVTALSMLGGWAEQVAVSPDNLTPTPDGLDDAQAVALLGNYQTMYFALAKRGALRPGETVLVLGSAGGIGVASIHREGVGRQGYRVGAPAACHGVRRVARRRRRAAVDRRVVEGGQGGDRRPRRRSGGRPDRR